MNVKCLLPLQLLYRPVSQKISRSVLSIIFRALSWMAVLPFSRPSMVLLWSLWYVSYTNQMNGWFTVVVLDNIGFRLCPQSTVHLIGTFCLTPSVTANASHPSTLRQKAWWWTSILTPSPLQSLMTNMSLSTSLTQGTQVRKFPLIYWAVLVTQRRTTITIIIYSLYIIYLMPTAS